MAEPKSTSSNLSQHIEKSQLRAGHEPQIEMKKSWDTKIKHRLPRPKST